jgi:two-component system, chemotaxis family, CheB/CheR fusion protein
VVSELSQRAILVVEDDLDTRQLFVAYLARQGADVRAAGSVAEAFELLETWHPDVALCDLHLATVDGYDLIAQLQADPRLADIPVVAISGSHPALERERALTAGFVQHLAKPTKLHAIVDSLVAAINAAPASVT